MWYGSRLAQRIFQTQRINFAWLKPEYFCRQYFGDSLSVLRTKACNVWLFHQVCIKIQHVLYLQFMLRLSWTCSITYFFHLNLCNDLTLIRLPFTSNLMRKSNSKVFRPWTKVNNWQKLGLVANGNIREKIKQNIHFSNAIHDYAIILI